MNMGKKPPTRRVDTCAACGHFDSEHGLRVCAHAWCSCPRFVLPPSPPLTTEEIDREFDEGVAAFERMTDEEKDEYAREAAERERLKWS